MLFSKQISDLKAQLQEQEGKLTAANGNVHSLTEEKTKLETRVGELEAAQTDAVPKAEHEAAIQGKDGEITKLAGEITGLKGQLEAAEKTVGKKVVEGIAKAGVPAAHRDPKAVDNPATGSGGTKLSPHARLAAATKVAGSTK